MRGGKDMFEYASSEFTEMYQNFKNTCLKEISEKSYDSDVAEYMYVIEKDFLKSDENTVTKYMRYLQKRVEDRKIKNITITKKFTELHNVSQFILKNYPDKGFFDFFYPHIDNLKKQSPKVKSIPLEDLDKLLQVARSDSQAYCIITLLYRAGFRTKEIINLKTDDLELYDNGLFAKLEGREKISFIPEDAAKILLSYIKGEQKGFVFRTSKDEPIYSMYISRIMKKYTELAEIPNYSAENIRNTCAIAMYSYHIDEEKIAAQIGIGLIQIKRYKKVSYNEELQTSANRLVNIKVIPPEY